jgi:predicted small lipoprotein YifL
MIGIETMKAFLLLLCLSLGLAACGIKGDPEPPPATQQAQ